MSDSTNRNSLDRDYDALIAFVLKKSQDSPLPERIQVLRGLQQLLTDPQAASNLNCVIDQLITADHLALQFRFDFENPKPAKGKSRS